jgi:hypothetical protein
MFNLAGLDINDGENLVSMLASQHKRKRGTKTWAERTYHDPKYHDYVEGKLNAAVKGLNTKTSEGKAAYKKAFTDALDNIKKEINQYPEMVNNFTEFGPGGVGRTRRR